MTVADSLYLPAALLHGVESSALRVKHWAHALGVNSKRAQFLLQRRCDAHPTKQAMHADDGNGALYTRRPNVHNFQYRATTDHERGHAQTTVSVARLLRFAHNRQLLWVVTAREKVFITRWV
jgi:hypothetical protein